ncbi:MAG: hypothetical protein WBM54_04565 [Woeseia sp.]
MLRATAPGKIVLAGEYAVLHGSHAIAAAVDRHAVVEIRPTAEAEIAIQAPGYAPGTTRYGVNSVGKLIAADAASQNADFGLFECTWATCDVRLKGGMHITLDTTAFVDVTSGRKLGLGSSAALCVALTAALRPELDAASVAALAGRAHREFQGAGSGVDIACAVAGGFIDYRQTPAFVCNVAVPQNLHFAILWSGRAASTVAKIQSLQASLQGRRQRATLQALQEQSDALASDWHGGDTARVFRRFDDYITALRAFDADLQLDIFGAGHAALTDAARDCGMLYKPCGAGGGDVGVAIARDLMALTEFIARAPEFGFAALDIKAGVDGLQRDGNRHDS